MVAKKSYIIGEKILGSDLLPTSNNISLLPINNKKLKDSKYIDIPIADSWYIVCRICTYKVNNGDISCLMSLFTAISNNIQLVYFRPLLLEHNLQFQIINFCILQSDKTQALYHISHDCLTNIETGFIIKCKFNPIIIDSSYNILKHI